MALNNNAGSAILPLDSAKLRSFYDSAEYFRVAERDGNLTGFPWSASAAAASTTAATSPWFKARYPHFFYIDRIVVASRRRGGGVGRAFYADVQSYAELRYPQLCCEVFLDHGADPALLFHGSFGFHEAGQNLMPDVDVRASMMTKQLCSYPWVHETYGDNLPDLPGSAPPPAAAARQSRDGYLTWRWQRTITSRRAN